MWPRRTTSSASERPVEMRVPALNDESTGSAAAAAAIRACVGREIRKKRSNFRALRPASPAAAPGRRCPRRGSTRRRPRRGAAARASWRSARRSPTRCSRRRRRRRPRSPPAGAASPPARRAVARWRQRRGQAPPRARRARGAPSDCGAPSAAKDRKSLTSIAFTRRSRVSSRPGRPVRRPPAAAGRAPTRRLGSRRRATSLPRVPAARAT